MWRNLGLIFKKSLWVIVAPVQCNLASSTVRTDMNGDNTRQSPTIYLCGSHLAWLLSGFAKSVTHCCIPVLFTIWADCRSYLSVDGDSLFTERLEVQKLPLRVHHQLQQRLRLLSNRAQVMTNIAIQGTWDWLVRKCIWNRATNLERFGICSWHPWKLQNSTRCYAPILERQPSK